MNFSDKDIELIRTAISAEMKRERLNVVHFTGEKSPPARSLMTDGWGKDGPVSGCLATTVAMVATVVAVVAGLVWLVVV